MVYEFAVSPMLCTNYQDLRFFLATFGREHGRLFSDIPRKKWMKFARVAIKHSDNGQVEKKRLVAGIEKLTKKAIYCRNSVPVIGSEDWLDHAIAAHEDRPFEAIITDGYDGDDECILKNEHEFTENPRWNIPLDKMVERNPQSMITAIKPMLDCAREVILIDRNFDPEKFRWLQLIIGLADFFSKREFSPSINKINYHMGNRLAPHHVELLCKKNLSTSLPTGITVNFIFWPWEELHDRYILTDIGGMDFGIGLDIHDGSGPENVKISRISENTRQQWWKACKAKNAAFSIPEQPNNQ